MKPPRMQFTIRRLMVAVSAVALLLAPARFARYAVPHFLHCRDLYLQADYEAQTCRSVAALCRKCALYSSPTPSIYYCAMPFMDHLPPGSAEQKGDRFADTRRAAVAQGRDRIAEEHRRAVDVHERIAEILAARARRCWRTAFRPWEPTPVWTEAERNADEELTRYRTYNKY